MQTKQRPLVVPRMVRQWAQQQGIEVGERGRIPEEVVERYRAAKKGQSSA